MDLRQLLDQCIEILRRDIKNIFVESSKGKLSPAAARDLVAYTKLLSDVLEESEEEASGASEEELKKIVNEKDHLTRTGS